MFRGTRSHLSYLKETFDFFSVTRSCVCRSLNCFRRALSCPGNSLFIGDVLICPKRLLMSDDRYTILSSGVINVFFECLCNVWSVWSNSLRHSMWRTSFECSKETKQIVNNALIEFDCLCTDWCLPEDANERGTSNNFIINRRNWKENYCVVKLMQFCWLCNRVPDWNVLFHLRTHKPCKLTANESNSKSLEVKCTAPLTFIIKSHSFYHRVQATMTYRHLTHFSNCPHVVLSVFPLKIIFCVELIVWVVKKIVKSWKLGK